MPETEFVDHWKNKREQRRLQLQALAEAARQELEPAVRVLVRQYGARRIILFGSLVKGRFVEGSDIDLAVEGLAPADFYPALAAVNRVTSRWVDLKPLEDLDPFFRRRVLDTGEILFPVEGSEHAVDTNQ